MFGLVWFGFVFFFRVDKKVAFPFLALYFENVHLLAVFYSSKGTAWALDHANKAQ